MTKAKRESEDTFEIFLSRIRDGQTTVSELAFWYWELLGERDTKIKELEKKEFKIKVLEKSCVCYRNSKITKKIF